MLAVQVRRVAALKTQLPCAVHGSESFGDYCLYRKQMSDTQAKILQ
jgi:hypothetical protein